MDNITLLTELRTKYIRALELKDPAYCLSHSLTCGLCLAMVQNHLMGSMSLLYTLYIKGLITKSLSSTNAYYWPTLDRHNASYEEAFTPRIEALNIMIKYLTDETNRDITKA